MNAVRSEKVADNSPKGAFLIACTGITNRAAHFLPESGAAQPGFRSAGVSPALLVPEFPPFLAQVRIRAPLATRHLVVQGGPLACPNERGVARTSNRELLVLEIPQLAENKHPRTVLIENFEPNQFSGLHASVAAAFRRAGFLASVNFPPPQRESAPGRVSQ